MRTQSATLWRHPDFLKLWIGESVSLFGSKVTLLALPLVAVLVLGAGPAEMGILGAAQYGPFLLFGLLAGVWVDRRRRPILIWTDIGRAALLGWVPLAAVLGILGIQQLYLVAFLIGTLTVFFDVAYQAFLPSLVRREQLVEGNSRLELSRSVAQIAGPGLGGALVQLLSAPVALVMDGLSFLVSALFLATLLGGLANLVVPLAGVYPAFALPILIGGFFVGGIGGTAYNVNTLSLRQAIGLQPTLVVAALGTQLTFLLAASSPWRRLREMPQDATPATPTR